MEERTEIPYVVCPLCGLHRKLHKNGLYALRRKKQEIRSRAAKYNPEKDTRFDIVNLEDEPFLSIRVSEGKDGGLKEVKTYTMKEAVKSEYKEDVIRLLEEMKEQIGKISKTIDRLLKATREGRGGR